MKTPTHLLLPLLLVSPQALTPQAAAQQPAPTPAPIVRVPPRTSSLPLFTLPRQNFPYDAFEPAYESTSAYPEPPGTFLPNAPMPHPRPRRRSVHYGAGYGYYGQPYPSSSDTIPALVVTAFFIILYAASR